MASSFLLWVSLQWAFMYVKSLVFFSLTSVGNFYNLQQGKIFQKSVSVLLYWRAALFFPGLQSSLQSFFLLPGGWWKLAHLALSLSVDAPKKHPRKGWSPAVVTLAITNIMGTPAQKNTRLGIRQFHFNIYLEFQSLCVVWSSLSHLIPTRTLNCRW